MTLTAETELSKFAGNLETIRVKTQKKLFSVIKANAYGHGAVGLCAVAERYSDALCVASLAEAVELVERANVKKPILIFSPLSDCESVKMVYENFVFTVCDIRDIPVIKKMRLPVKSVALKINTGMNRTGVAPHEVPFALNLIRLSGFQFHSVFSHLYNAFDELESEKQLELFLKLTNDIPRQVIRHIAASSALWLPEKFTLDAVRPGLALYGYGSDAVVPITKISAPILKTFQVRAGEHVSYGDYIAPRNMRLALISAGYADGIRRKAEPHAENRFVSINGILCPIIGQVCMDLTLADISNAKTAIAGGQAFFVGNGAGAIQSAAVCNTNVYEILTAIFSGRIKKVYCE